MDDYNLNYGTRAAGESDLSVDNILEEFRLMQSMTEEPLPAPAEPAPAFAEPDLPDAAVFDEAEGPAAELPADELSDPIAWARAYYGAAEEEPVGAEPEPAGVMPEPEALPDDPAYPEEPEYPEERPAPRRGEARGRGRAAKKKSLFSRLRGARADDRDTLPPLESRRAEPDLTPAYEDDWDDEPGAEDAFPAYEPGQRGGTDLFRDDADTNAYGGELFADGPEDGPRSEVPAFAGHGGAIGEKEREARSYIAQLQAESGVSGRRGRRSAEDYTYNLDELLHMDFGGEQSAAEPVYDPELAHAMAYDPDPTQYAADAAAPVFSAEEPEIDSRFRLDGTSGETAVSYGGHEIDLSADEDYAPVEQNEYSPSHWTPDYDDPLAEREEPHGPERKKHKFRFGLRRRRAAAEDVGSAAQDAEEELGEEFPAVTAGFEDEELAPARYAEDDDYGYGESDEADDAPEESFGGEPGRRRRAYRDSELYAPPTFREYLLSLLASFWLRLRGTVRGSTAETMSDSEEDLGPELTPAAASKYYGSFIRSLKLRVRIAAGLLAILFYVSLEAPVPGMLRTLPVAAAFCFAMQSAILLLSLDVVTNAVTNVFRRRFGADSLAVTACLFTGADALLVALYDGATPHMPLCAISSASVMGLLLASFLSARGLRKATRVPAIGKRFYAVTGEPKLRPGEITLLKSLRSAQGFVRRTEEAGPDETLYVKIAPLLLALALLMTGIVMVAKKSYGEFVYLFSALLAPAVPFGAMLSFALPFFLGSTRIFKFGAAIAGWSGLCDIGTSRNLIVTDRDLFPESAISIDSVRIFADEDAQKVISYAGTMMSASGCCSAGCFAGLMKETASPMRQVDGFEFLPGGGMKGIIDGHVVLCGSTDLMRLMNVRIPFRLTDKTTVLLAIDGILYGIFSLKYEALPQIRRALVELMRSSRAPVFAVRDFNVNPEMLHNTFDLATDGYDFPPFVERFELSEPSEDRRGEHIAAVLCNEGLGPLTNVADVGRSMYMATRINLLLSVLASVIGLFLVFVRFLATGSNSLASLFVYVLAWVIPVLAVSFFVSVKK